jgi:hypothetical protein
MRTEYALLEYVSRPASFLGGFGENVWRAFFWQRNTVSLAPAIFRIMKAKIRFFIYPLGISTTSPVGLSGIGHDLHIQTLSLGRTVNDSIGMRMVVLEYATHNVTPVEWKFRSGIPLRELSLISSPFLCYQFITEQRYLLLGHR